MANRAKKRRKIAVVTGSRAEYGLLSWIIKGINDDPGLRLQLIVTGMHLSAAFGSTVKQIERDGFPIAARVKMLSASDMEEAVAESIGRGIIGFAKAYKRLKPDIVVLLGDRFEILSAATAALPFRIPLAHIHGGEATKGAFDEQIRHAITKMSHIHFPANEKYRRRIIQMGEDPKYSFCFGAPTVDNITRLKLLDRAGLCGKLKIPADKKIGVVTYHPVTLEGSGGARIEQLLSAVEKFKDIRWVFTAANADTGGRGITRRIRRFIRAHPDSAKLYMALGPQLYLSLLKNAAVMVGNSSSGLIEAPSFRLPVVNIGDRQTGRIKAGNVIDVGECRKGPIERAIRKALSAGFKRSLKGLKNPYGGSNVSGRIVRKLKAISLDGALVKKSFHEVLR
jgi:UDP-hydrolysing UDP-N-acetyl-D-glucosamine 2-epimerase